MTWERTNYMTSVGGWVTPTMTYASGAEDPWLWWNTTSTTTTNLNTWEYWNTGVVWPRFATQEYVVHNSEYEARYRAQVERETLERAARQAGREAANVTARALLESLLSPQQLVQLAERKFFDVPVPSGRIYRIMCTGSKAGNVQLLAGNGDEVAASFCAHLYNEEPTTDSYIAQMLALQDDEEGFLAVANMSRYRHDIEIPRPERTRALRAVA